MRNLTPAIQCKSEEGPSFERYLRTGLLPRPRTVSDEFERGLTERYVWVVKNDDKVRPSHRANDGKIFSWSNPPATGHPGEDYNCRCTALPYVPGQTEFASHTFITNLDSPNRPWTDADAVNHYYFGQGRAVTLFEIGHLRLIAEYYAYQTLGDGAFRRLSNEIADAAREDGPGRLTGEVRNSYDFKPVAFFHGGGTVVGTYTGSVVNRNDMLQVSCTIRFTFTDTFKEPFDIPRIESPGAITYDINGEWSTSFSGAFSRDGQISIYKTP